MKINSCIRPYSEEHNFGSDGTTVIMCHSGRDDSLGQHVLIAAKRKGKSAEWVVNRTTLLPVRISINSWLASSCLSYVITAHAPGLKFRKQSVYCRNE